ncbi:hypothetical protein UK23_24020, partial [Lentzea aerocolonigenes]
MYVAVEGAAGGFELRLTDGSPVRVDGWDFGRLLGGLDRFGHLAASNQGGSLVLLSGRSGLSGAAEGFQRGLAAAGWDHLVVAPTTDVHLRTGSWLDTGGQLVLDRGGSWRTFPAPDAVHGVELPAMTADGQWTRFRTSEVRSTVLRGPDGAPIGMEFLVGADLREHQSQMSRPHRGTTMRLGESESTWWRSAQDLRDGTDSSRPAPWPERSAYVVLHGNAEGADFTLTDGRTVGMSGDVLARALHDLRPFRELMAGREALVLLSCETGAVREMGGVAHDFQRTLAEFGYRQPVVAPAANAGIHTHRGDGTWETYVRGDGRWEHFSSGAALALGRLPQEPRWVSFDPAAVRSASLMRDGRAVGVTFWDGPEPAPRHEVTQGMRLPQRTFYVSAQSAVDGSLVVHAADGRTLHVDG